MLRFLPSTTAWLLSACMAAGPATLTATPADSMSSTLSKLDTVVAAALADASKRSNVPVAALKVESAESVTWRDGSLGCPQLRMNYTQALVPGFRVRIRAGDSLFDYHASRGGTPQLCPPGRAQEPLSGNPKS